MVCVSMNWVVIIIVIVIRNVGEMFSVIGFDRKLNVLLIYVVCEFVSWYVRLCVVFRMLSDMMNDGIC